MTNHYRLSGAVLGLLVFAALIFGDASLVQAASVYNVTETTGTVGTAATFEIEYTVDTAQQTWATADTLTLTIPGNLTGPTMSLTAEYDSDTNNDGVGETAISAGPGNGQYALSGGNVITVKWNLVAWGAVVNNASTIRILLSSTPSYENTNTTLSFGGSTANGSDANPSGSDTLNISAADASATITLSTNSVVGVAGNTTLALSLPVRLGIGDTVQVTLPNNLRATAAAFVSETFTGAGTFASCNGVSQVVTCLAGGVIDPGTGNIVLSGISANYAKTGQSATSLDVRDTSANASKARDNSVSVTDTTAGTLTGGSVTPFKLNFETLSPHQVTLTSNALIPNGGKITVVYPNGWDVSRANGMNAVDVTMNGTWGITVAGQTVTLTQVGGGVTGAGPQSFVIPQVFSPASNTGGTFTISTLTSSNETIETQSGIPELTLSPQILTPPETVGVPSDFSLADGNGGGVLLTWVDPIDAGLKEVLVFKYNPDGSNTGYLIASVAKGTQSYVDTNVKEGETVYYFLRAQGKRWVGNPTSTLSFVVGSSSISESSSGGTVSGPEENTTEENTSEENTTEENPIELPEEVSLFEDVGNSLIAPVNYLAEAEIVEGNPDGTFAPERDLNNAEAAALVIRLTGTESSADENPYSDVPEDAWYKDYALTLHEEGLLEADEFNPEEAVETRQFIDWLRALYPEGSEKIEDICKESFCGSTEPLTRGEAAEIIYQMIN